MTTNSIVYGLFGIGAIAYGIATLLVPGMILPEAGQSVHFAHILREQGAEAIFIGLVAFWCIVSDERRPLHYCLMIFAFLLAAIHWFDYFAGHLRWMSALYTSIPFVVLLVLAVRGRRGRGFA